MKKKIQLFFNSRYSPKSLFLSRIVISIYILLEILLKYILFDFAGVSRGINYAKYYGMRKVF